MSDIWKLVEKHQYQAAIDEYSKLMHESGASNYLFPRGFVYFLNRNYEAALKDYLSALESLDDATLSASNHLNLGICYWYLDLPKEAIAAFRQALLAPYTDAAGGVIPAVIMLYAAERLNDVPLRNESFAILKKHWHNHLRRQKRRQAQGSKLKHYDFVHQGLFGWPGPLVPYLLDKISSEDLQALVDKSTTDPTLRSRHQCQADFAIGIVALHKDDYQTFRASMKACVDCEKGYHEREYYLAQWEEERNFPQPAYRNSSS